MTLIGVHLFGVDPTTYPNYVANDLTVELAAMPSNLTCARVFFPWNALQSGAGTFTALADHYDDILAALDAEGLKLIANTTFTPAWSRGGAGTPQDPPSSPELYETWVSDMLDRWAEVIEFVSLDPWNEPHVENSGFDGTTAQMVELIQATHSAIGGAFDCSLPAGSWLEHVQGFFAAGLTGNDFDTVDIHPYPISFTDSAWIDPRIDPRHPEDHWTHIPTTTAEITAWLATQGVTGKQFWISECGVGVNPQDPNEALRMDDAYAAVWTELMLNQAFDHPDIKGVCVHEAKDFTSGASWAQAWGLVDDDLNRRAKWYAVANAVG